ncbi:hypothetical protein SDC9_186466 [bioreactor metagenome]|uniref:Uncharacterized protein n=1 Tax=bioreactor metagenome TaxID=1076179 RepID=A0A645HIU4_9ZZZZ
MPFGFKINGIEQHHQGIFRIVFFMQAGDQALRLAIDPGIDGGEGLRRRQIDGIDLGAEIIGAVLQKAFFHADAVVVHPGGVGDIERRTTGGLA